MAWTVDYTDDVRRQLNRLGSTTTRRIVRYLDERVAPLENPRQNGHRLTGDLDGLWRYRVGKWRIVCEIQDEVLVVLVVDVGNRDQIYR